MDLTLVAIGLAKLIFSLVVGVVGVSLAARLATRFAGFASVDEGLREGNRALGIVVGASILSVAVFVQHAVTATFGALDLLRYAQVGAAAFAAVAGYAIVHVGAALGFGALLVMVATRSFVRLTPEVDEVAEIHGGNVASALVLAAVLLALALLAQQGVETVLDGMLPLPRLGRDGVATMD